MGDFIGRALVILASVFLQILVMKGMEDSQFRFFTGINFGGLVYHANYTPGCHNLPTNFSSKANSINTHNKCVRVHAGQDCNGESRDFYPGTSYTHSNVGHLSNLIKSWEPCSIPNRTEASRNPDGRIRFYMSSQLQGKRNSVNYSDQGCQGLPRMYRGGTQSLSTGGHCIRVFSLGYCLGESKVFSGTFYDLGTWRNKIRSFESCAYSVRTYNKESHVTFYFGKNFTGREYTGRYTSGCHNLQQDLIADAHSLDTGDNCVRVFAQIGCMGEENEFIGTYSTLENWGARIASWERCSTPRKQPQSQQVAFFFLKNFSGDVHMDRGTPGCVELPKYFRLNIRSLLSHNTCQVTVFSEAGCGGDKRNFSGEHADLGDWNSRIRSWRGCSVLCPVGSTETGAKEVDKSMKPPSANNLDKSAQSPFLKSNQAEVVLVSGSIQYVIPLMWIVVGGGVFVAVVVIFIMSCLYVKFLKKKCHRKERNVVDEMSDSIKGTEGVGQPFPHLHAGDSFPAISNSPGNLTSAPPSRYAPTPRWSEDFYEEFPQINQPQEWDEGEYEVPIHISNQFEKQ